tara:strand:- start:7786 stop:8709 length:924 start_codon:yes stop_codon:yes gene_type:complete
VVLKFKIISLDIKELVAILTKHIANMIRHLGLLFLLTFFFIQTSNSQSIENFGRTNRLIGTGTIGKDLKISMTLDLISRTDYSSDMCITKNYDQIIGSYSYLKNGGGIPIIGQRINWTFDSGENDSLVVYELNDNFDKIAEFKGNLSKSSFSGTWINLKNKKELPFQINFNSTYFGNLSVLFKGERMLLSGFETFSFQSTYELIDKIEKNDTLYLITRTMEPCCGYYNCRGMNCGGSNEYLYLSILTQNYQKYYKELISSGCNWLEIVNTTKTSDAYGVVTEDSEGQYIVKIDYNNFGKGIQKIKLK